MVWKKSIQRLKNLIETGDILDVKFERESIEVTMLADHQQRRFVPGENITVTLLVKPRKDQL